MDETLGALLTAEERLERADREVGELKQAFVEAITQLQQSAEVDGSFQERFEAVSERLHSLRQGLRTEDYDKQQINEFHNALWEIRDLIDKMDGTYDLDTFDALLLNVERMRHVIRDALDEHVSGLGDDVGMVLEELKGWLPATPQWQLAELVGVDRRTLLRWADQSGPPSARLALVARLVAILRHNWTEAGIVTWFSRPRRDLGRRKPISLLDDPNYEARLLSAARSSRSQFAT